MQWTPTNTILAGFGAAACSLLIAPCLLLTFGGCVQKVWRLNFNSLVPRAGLGGRFLCLEPFVARLQSCASPQSR